MQDIKLLYKTNNTVEADLLKGLLDSAGIVILSKSESASGAANVTVDGWGLIRIFVSTEQFKKAKEILDDFLTKEQ